jgi:hypothetical protein
MAADGDTAPPAFAASVVVSEIAEVLTSDAVEVPTAWASLFDTAAPFDGDVESDEQAATARVPKAIARVVRMSYLGGGVVRLALNIEH